MQKNLDIAIMGGTFNPIHNGHIHAAYTVLERMSPDIVLFMVSGIPPHKLIENEREIKRHRFEMTRLAISDEPCFKVSDIELKNNGISYTIDTLNKVKAIYEPRNISLILGTDMFLSFEKWKSYDKIFDICNIIVLPRFFDSIEEIERKRRCEFKKWEDKIKVIDAEIIEISSTKLREMAKKGESLDGFVPVKVARYIKDNNIYK